MRLMDLSGSQMVQSAQGHWRRHAKSWRIGEFALQEFGQWAVVLKETQTFIGWAGLQFYLLDHGMYSTPEIELFYGLSRAYWGQGLITEDSKTLVHYGFHTLKLLRITGC